MNDTRPKCIFLDIDGCIFEHPYHPNNHHVSPHNLKLLPGVVAKFNEWIMKEYKIILVTGRKECTRAETESQLRHYGLVWDQLVMGIGGGVRVLINDKKPNHSGNTADAITIERNVGMENIYV
jgi:hypothetical protein